MTPLIHMSDLTKVTLAAVGWEIMNHLSYSSGLVPSDIHLFGPMKVHPGGQKFQTNDQLEHSVFNWLQSQDKTFYAAGIVSFPGQWTKYVNVKGECRKGFKIW
jgi:hypothetical protein